MTRFPNFLIVGAMKCGTSSLFWDIARHPDVFMPDQKEPEGLFWCGSKKGVKRYASLFRGAHDARAVGEASTAYTKRPIADGIASRARETLGPNVTIVYMVREPIDRMISQYRHMVGYGLEYRDVEDALLSDSAYISYSRYAWQIMPWIDCFGAHNVHTFSFENYVKERSRVVNDIFQLLCVDPLKVEVDITEVRNVSSGKYVAKGVWLSVLRSRFYNDRIRPYLSNEVRDRLKHMLLPQAPKEFNTELSQDAVSALRGNLSLEDYKVWRAAK